MSWRVFDLSIYTSSVDSSMLLVARDGEVVTNLTDKSRQHRSGSLAWEYGQGHKAEFAMCVCRPRCGRRTFVSLTDVYKVLNLKSYKGIASKWQFNSMPSWQRALKDLSFEDCFLWSPGSLPVEEAAISTTHFLPWVGSSSLGILYLLCRFMQPVSQHGGLQEVEGRNHVASVARGLINGIARSSSEQVPFDVPLVFNYLWSCTWPRPNAWKPDLVLRVDAEGMVDLAAWIASAKTLSNRNQRPKAKWFAVVSELGRKCHLKELMMAAICAPKSRKAGPFLAQLLWHVSGHMEKVIAANVTHPDKLNPDGLQASLHEAADMVKTPRDVDLLLVRHLDSVQRATARAQYFSIAADKAQVKSLSLLNSVLVLPTNEATVMPPQVASPQSAPWPYGCPRAATTLYLYGVYTLCAVYNSRCLDTQSGSGGHTPVVEYTLGGV